MGHTINSLHSCHRPGHAHKMFEGNEDDLSSKGEGDHPSSINT